MKKLILIFFLFTATIIAQSSKVNTKKSKNNISNASISSSGINREVTVPRKISYQGLITKADGTPTSDGSYKSSSNIMISN